MSDGFYQQVNNQVAAQQIYVLIVGKASDDDDPSEYPVMVYNVNGDPIGTAADKQSYMDLWNGDGFNQHVGQLTGFYGPFCFQLKTNNSAWISTLKTLKIESQSETDYWIDADGTIVQDEKGYYIFSN